MNFTTNSYLVIVPETKHETYPRLTDHEVVSLRRSGTKVYSRKQIEQHIQRTYLLARHAAWAFSYALDTITTDPQKAAKAERALNRAEATHSKWCERERLLNRSGLFQKQAV